MKFCIILASMTIRAADNALEQHTGQFLGPEESRPPLWRDPVTKVLQTYIFWQSHLERAVAFARRSERSE